MAGTKAGAAKARQRLIEKYGEDFFRHIGKRGGAKKSPLKGFGSMSAEKRIAAGRKGGTVSRRGKA